MQRCDHTFELLPQGGIKGERSIRLIADMRAMYRKLEAVLRRPVPEILTPSRPESGSFLGFADAFGRFLEIQF